MLELKTATGLSVDSLIKVKIAARNGKGYGAYSEMNSAGALIEDKPKVMDAPSFNAATITNS
jgi:hypothetical protein